MGFYLLSDLSNGSVEHNKGFERYIASLRAQTKKIANHNTAECLDDSIDSLKQIHTILEMYLSIISNKLYDHDGNTTSKRRNIEKKFFDTVNNKNTKDEIKLRRTAIMDDNNPTKVMGYKLLPVELSPSEQSEKDEIYSMSQLSLAFIMLIEGYIESTGNSLNRSIADLELNNHFVKHGIVLLGTLHAWIVEEIIATPKILSHINKETEFVTKLNISKNATDFRYSPGRDLYRAALHVARTMWENGSDLKHHQMKSYLVNMYRDGESIKSPFEKFDAACGYTDRGLLKHLKALVKEMNRPDLISGQKI